MKSPTTAVQPSMSGNTMVCEVCKPVQVSALIQYGVDEQVANDLYQRLTNGIVPEDKFARAAVQSFIDTVVSFTKAGCRLTPVC